MPESCDTLIGDNMYHVVLGAGSAKVGMRKQSITDVYIYSTSSVDVGYSELRIA